MASLKSGQNAAGICPFFLRWGRWHFMKILYFAICIFASKCTVEIVVMVLVSCKVAWFSQIYFRRKLQSHNLRMKQRQYKHFLPWNVGIPRSGANKSCSQNRKFLLWMAKGRPDLIHFVLFGKVWCKNLLRDGQTIKCSPVNKTSN